ncbi:TadE/TadG family type IV pilus assembly protein [Aquibium microcysteis]|uniref:TadE/TadG family type IV pilus assembly protein n=1 Tax=Aquibium microcysteis TaxID=675281 RepID=UPI00165CF6D4|nr:TadE/TadG family type IV pilus assembly protein [Aquibium microcysteis]
MRRALRRFLACRAGSSAVEVAILALPMFALLFGSIEGGRAYWTSQAVKDVATSVARCIGIAQPECAPGGTFDAAQARTYAVAAARGLGVLLDPDLVEIDGEGTCAGIGGFAVVTVSYRFLSPVGFVFPEDIVMTGQSCFPVAGG